MRSYDTKKLAQSLTHGVRVLAGHSKITWLYSVANFATVVRSKSIVVRQIPLAIGVLLRRLGIVVSLLAVLAWLVVRIRLLPKDIRKITTYP